MRSSPFSGLWLGPVCPTAPGPGLYARPLRESFDGRMAAQKESAGATANPATLGQRLSAELGNLVPKAAPDLDRKSRTRTVGSTLAAADTVPATGPRAVRDRTAEL